MQEPWSGVLCPAR